MIPPPLPATRDVCHNPGVIMYLILVARRSRVYTATIAQFGSLRVRIHAAGRDTTFGRVIRMVEQAEANRADIQRVGDCFSTYHLPVIAVIALLPPILAAAAQSLPDLGILGNSSRLLRQKG